MQVATPQPYFCQPGTDVSVDWHILSYAGLTATSVTPKALLTDVRTNGNKTDCQTE